MTDTRGAKPAEPGASPGEKHGRDLKKVNERLRDLVSSLKSQTERLAEARAATPVAAAPAPDAGTGAGDLEKRRLVAELALAREGIEHANAERERLRDRLAEIEAENQRVSDEYVAVEERSSEIAQLFVALDRIHGGVTRGEVLTAIQEVVINVVGTEELAILEVRGDRLAVLQSFGVDPEPLHDLRVGEGAIGRAVATGELYVAGRDDAEPAQADRDLTACIPLRAGERVWGAIAVFRLLGHKPGLGASDQAVFDLLAAHAGLALQLRAAAPAGAVG